MSLFDNLSMTFFRTRVWILAVIGQKHGFIVKAWNIECKGLIKDLLRKNDKTLRMVPYFLSHDLEVLLQLKMILSSVISCT